MKYLLFLFFPLLFLSFSSPETNDAKDLSVSLQSPGNDSIRVVVKNNSKKTILAYSHVIAYEKQYDYFEAEVITPDGEKFFLDFYDDREKSASVIVTLKPGESFSHTINLLQWAERPVNKDALKKAGFNYMPRGVQVRIKYFNDPCNNCNAYYKSIWTGIVYSGPIPF